MYQTVWLAGVMPNYLKQWIYAYHIVLKQKSNVRLLCFNAITIIGEFIVLPDDIIWLSVNKMKPVMKPMFISCNIEENMILSNQICAFSAEA